jgi:hypothetical protein|tara:strand:+ start:1219 stop:1731 length:513 start_codon:yes stop_codon:yes gene_type:complete
MSNLVLKHAFLGHLLKIPFPNKPSAALARFMPLTNDNDYNVFTNLPCSKAPVLINFIEHYQILNELVLFANELWQQELTILIRISMPGGMRLPASLLASNVLLMQDIQPEVKKLSGEVTHLLTIDDNFIRYHLEQGNNQISINLHSVNKNQQATFSKFIAKLEHYNIGAK